MAKVAAEAAGEKVRCNLVEYLEKTFDKLGIPLEERLALSGTAVDAIQWSLFHDSEVCTFQKLLIKE